MTEKPWLQRCRIYETQRYDEKKKIPQTDTKQDNLNISEK